MKRSLSIAVAVLALLGATLGASTAQAAFGFKNLDVTFTEADGSTAAQAGSHPYAMATSFDVNSILDEGGQEYPEEEAKTLEVWQIPGLAGNPTAVPRCSAAEFIERTKGVPHCPDSSAVGFVRVKAAFDPIPPGVDEGLHVAVYNLEPPPGGAARFGFVALNVPIVIDATVSQAPPYEIRATVENIPQAVYFYSSKLTLWGNPADSDHDPIRGKCVGEGLVLSPAPVSLGNCPVEIPEEPFLTLPRACQGPLATKLRATSWKSPNTFTTPIEALTHDSNDPPQPLGMVGCSKLSLQAEIGAKPTTSSAESASGLDFDLAVEDEGLTSVEGNAGSDIRAIRVALPEGMTVNPSSAEGLGVCTKADLGRERLGAAPGTGCPEASKLGSISVRSPLLENPLGGALYIAAPDDPATTQPGAENPFDSLIALYVVLRSTEYGILIKQAGKVTPDPRTGQLVSSFQELPQLPFSDLSLRFREGPRSPLVTPPLCGAYEVKAQLTPWAGGPALPASSSFLVSSGAGAGSCPAAGRPPFEPGFGAGTLNNSAGSHSPFYMRLTRRDGDQDLTRFAAQLPPGMVAKLAGTTRCPDAAIAAARSRRGRDELAAPSCPASSQIGRVMAGAGVGEALTYVPGSVYLAGPYNGAPLSVAAIVPAVAGPFDVGTVVTRQALRIDRRSAVVRVDDAASDPIPHILAGIPLKVRDVRVYVDRPQFTLNPTSCDPFEVGASLWGGGTDVFGSADDSPVERAERFQAAGCAALGFRPRLSLALRGGTRRGAFPALRGEYRPRPGDANLKRLVLRLPRSAFLEQGHIGTICTRVQFAADACPPRSVYGRARAFTPLLEQPLEGPVYLRSSDNNLPDFVADLRGLIDVEAVARIDSHRGGIRATFSDVPDAPLSRVVVNMQGAKKGLIVNSTDLCANRNRADAAFTGQNAARSKQRPAMRVRCGGKKRRR